MHINIELNQKINELDQCVFKMVSAFTELVEDAKYNAAEDAFERSSKEIFRLRDEKKAFPKSLIMSTLVYLNLIVQSISKYQRKYNKFSREAKDVGTYIKENIENTSHKLKEKYDDLVSKFLYIDKELSKRFEDTYPKLDYYCVFLDIAPISKSDFLGLFSFYRNSDYNDGSRCNYIGTNKTISKLPEVIDGDAFMKFAVADSALLTDQALSGYFMDQCYKKMEDAGVDIFKGLQEALGKPLPTFSCKQDEFGNVTEVTQNKPNLRLV